MVQGFRAGAARENRASPLEEEGETPPVAGIRNRWGDQELRVLSNLALRCTVGFRKSPTTKVCSHEKARSFAAAILAIATPAQEKNAGKIATVQRGAAAGLHLFHRPVAQRGVQKSCGGARLAPGDMTGPWPPWRGPSSNADLAVTWTPLGDCFTSQSFTCDLNHAASWAAYLRGRASAARYLTAPTSPAPKKSRRGTDPGQAGQRSAIVNAAPPRLDAQGR